MNRRWTKTLAAAALLGAYATTLGQPAPDRPYYPPPDQGPYTHARNARLQNANRATQIVGTHVWNYQDQDLGRIDDVVFDFRTGRIAYAVLRTPGPYGDKLVAVPPAALANAPLNGDRLVLNLDRARLDRVPAFAMDRWPDLERPFAGAEDVWGPLITTDRYAWRDEPTAPPYSVRTWREDTTVYPPGNQGAPPRYEGATGSSFTVIPERARTERSTFRGRVVAVSPENRTITIESANGETRDFVFADRPTITLKDSRNPSIVDIKVGYPVTVGFRESPDGRYVAQTLIRSDAPEVR